MESFNVSKEVMSAKTIKGRASDDLVKVQILPRLLSNGTMALYWFLLLIEDFIN
jgi:hypothetical protein